MFEVKVAGIVHALESIRSPIAYANATFNNVEGLNAGADGKQLNFFYEPTFVVESIEKLLTELVTDSTNVEWDLMVKTIR